MRISSIQAEAYSICGTLALEHASPSKRNVIIKGPGASSTVTTDNKGAFCAMLPPGNPPEA